MASKATTTCESYNYCGTLRTLGTHGRADKHKNAVETVIRNHENGCKRMIANKKAAIPGWCPKSVELTVYPECQKPFVFMQDYLDELIGERSH